MMDYGHAKRIAEAAFDYRTAVRAHEEARRATHNANVVRDAAINAEQESRKRKSDARAALDTVLHEGL